MKRLDRFCSGLYCIAFLIAATDSKTTQCNTKEYRSLVLNLEALRAQYKELKLAFDELVNTEVANLKAKDIVIQSDFVKLAERIDGDIGALQAKDNALEIAVDSLNQTNIVGIPCLEAADDVLQTSIDCSFNTTIPELEAKYKAIDERLDSVDNVTSTIVSSLASHNSSINGLEQQYTVHEGNITSNDQGLSDLATATTDLTDRIDALEAGKLECVRFPTMWHFEMCRL